jgi:mono/diheme cytochrome c family protein
MSWSSYSKVTSAVAVVVLASILTPAAAADPATAEAGQSVYAQTCIACHGVNGKGMIPGVSDLTAADGPLAKSDDALITSIRDGLVTPGKALSMPPKGGNPSLSDADIKAVLAYLRDNFGS